MTYHPDDVIDREIAAIALDAERFDLSIGYPPRAWECPDCGKAHRRGHFGTIGVHRCLSCGYVGDGGVMFGSAPVAARPVLADQGEQCPSKSLSTGSQCEHPAGHTGRHRAMVAYVWMNEAPKHPADQGEKP